MNLMRNLTSLPLRECGLKYPEWKNSTTVSVVTPLAGVWIEILYQWYAKILDKVTPLAGVWIEIATLL